MAEAVTTRKTFCLPDLGEGLTEAEVVAWHIHAGDHVVADQPIVAIETDKAIVDIPAPHAGHIAKLVVDVGERVQVGDVLFTYTSDDAVQAEPTSIVGDLGSGTTKPGLPAYSGAVKASPVARKRARELGVQLSGVTATGPGGVIQVSDVEAAVGQPSLKGVRRAMAERMASAQDRVVRASVTGEADITNWPEHTRTILRLIRGIGRACDVQPLLNARFDDGAMQLKLQNQVNLGIAMETADGLFVPVLNDINNTEPDTLADNLQALQAAVTDRTISADRLRGQTITLSNFGAVGGLHAEMVVVPPQVAIVGAGRAFHRAVMVHGEPADHRFLPLSISFDHRVVTGAEACEFLLALTLDLEMAE